MNLYKLSFAHIEKLVAAENEEAAKAIGENPEKSPDLYFRPFEVRKIEVDGYDITVEPKVKEAPKKRK